MALFLPFSFSFVRSFIPHTSMIKTRKSHNHESRMETSPGSSLAVISYPFTLFFLFHFIHSDMMVNGDDREQRVKRGRRKEVRKGSNGQAFHLTNPFSSSSLLSLAFAGIEWEQISSNPITQQIERRGIEKSLSHLGSTSLFHSLHLTSGDWE